MDNKLISELSKFIDRDEDSIKELVITLDFKDLVKLTSALRQNNKQDALEVLHGYSL